MRRERGQLVLETTDYKILQTVSLLNEKNIYPLNECVFRILIGDDTDEVIQFKELPTYKTLISINQKKVSRYVVMLVRYKYLVRIYDETTDEMYLKIAPLGEMELTKYLKNRRYKYVKKKVKIKPLYIVLEKN